MLRKIAIPFLAILYIAITINSCANYSLNIANDRTGWEEEKPNDTLEIAHTMYLIGDAGNSLPGSLAPPLALLNSFLEESKDSVSVIFLGDNIYPRGLPPKRIGAERELAENRLLAQLEILKGEKVRPLFIPGNHDWRTYGLKGLKRQEDYVEEYLNEGIEDKDKWLNYFLPDNGCGGPELVEINDNLVIIAIDTQWWLLDWNQEPRINEDCEAKSREIFISLLEEMIRQNRRKNIVLAMHHPPFSNGTHGGFYTTRQHLFPLTDINETLLIPIPLIGSIASVYRGIVGSKQDISNFAYRGMRSAILNAADVNGSFIFASGHEHSLQFFKNGKHDFILSGAGSKIGPARLGNGAEFAYGRKGFAQVDFYEDGSSWVKYWVVKADGTGRLVYRRKMKDALPVLEEEKPKTFDIYNQHIDSIAVHVLNTKVQEQGFLGKVLLGEHYREIYTHEYTFPVLDMTTYKGGLQPVKLGSGSLTSSLRLKDAEGHSYIMRSMAKDASRFVPYPFNKIATTEINVEDKFYSTHPFAALATAQLAESANVYHTNPALYFVPSQPALGSYNDQFGSEVYLLEERPDGDWSNLASFGNSDKIISTPNVAGKIVEKRNHYVDQKWVAKSRLFDMVIGDWDRHDDQWRWATFEDESGNTIYRPIPRDRDQAFSKYDGLFTSLSRATLPFLKQMRPYRPNVYNIKWANYNARQFDKTFLNGLAWEDWKKEVEGLQQRLTDDQVEKAFEKWPKQVYDETAPEIISILKQRRDNLMSMARLHYLLLAQEVDVYGTDGRELFEIERINDNETVVRMYDTNKELEKEKLLYERLFYTDETNEIHIYGLAGEDVFRINGEVRKGPKIRIVGGLDYDEFLDSSIVHGLTKKNLIYDTPVDNKLVSGPDTKNKMSERRDWNLYNRKDFHYEYDFLVPLPLLGYNPDNGVFLGTELMFTNYQYKKVPYGQQHILSAKFAFATRAIDFQYSGDFREALGNYDLLIEAGYQAPTYTLNYFGLGNESERVDFSDANLIEYYRYRQRLFSIMPSVKKKFLGEAGKLSLGPLFESIRVEKAADRFITSPDNGLPPDIFETKNYGGAEFGLRMESIDKFEMISRGVIFDLKVGWKANLGELSRNFGYWKAEMSIYQALTENERLVLATKFGAMKNFGKYDFYQSAILGGNSNLRGYPAQRFYGESNFFQNTDLRYKLFTLKNNVMPFSVGLIAGFDYGRVWQQGERSGKWHSAYGGGLWIAPIDYIIIRGTLFKSAEEHRLNIGIGFAF